jgi:hypothetical protein
MTKLEKQEKDTGGIIAMDDQVSITLEIDRDP